jgi:hypothetical protein
VNGKFCFRWKGNIVVIKHQFIFWLFFEKFRERKILFSLKGKYCVIKHKFIFWLFFEKFSERKILFSLKGKYCVIKHKFIFWLFFEKFSERLFICLGCREILLSSNNNWFSACFWKKKLFCREVYCFTNGCSFVWVVGKYCCRQTTIDSLPVFERKNYFVAKSIVSWTVVHVV